MVLTFDSFNLISYGIVIRSSKGSIREEGREAIEERLFKKRKENKNSTVQGIEWILMPITNYRFNCPNNTPWYNIFPISIVTTIAFCGSPIGAPKVEKK